MTYAAAKRHVFERLLPSEGEKFVLSHRDTKYIGYNGTCTVVGMNKNELAEGWWVSYTLVSSDGHALVMNDGVSMRWSVTLTHWWDWLNDGTLKPL